MSKHLARTANIQRKIALLIAWGILLVESVLIAIHYQAVWAFVQHYAWVTPIFFLKTFIKQFLILNLFGILKVLWGLVLHLVKLLLLKILKTFGVRYGTYFSTRQWRKTTQWLRIIGKYFSSKQRQLQRLMATFRKREYVLIIVAFFPIFALLFLFGVAWKLTREAMVKKGSELGVTKMAFESARKSEGLIARLRRLDTWILAQIERLTQKKQNKKK